MQRLFVRRARLFPGPLKVVSEVERSPVSVTALAMTAAAIAAGLALVPQLSQRRSVDPAPMVEIATATATLPQPIAPSVAAALPKPAAAPPEPRLAAVPETSRASSAPAASAKAGMDLSLYQVAGMPALQADLAGLDIGGSPPKIPARRASRGTQAPQAGTAVAAAAGPVRP